ncbi:MAG: hypothetical protein NVS9B14_18980 [Candidatus Acidiferrum sp.]
MSLCWRPVRVLGDAYDKDFPRDARLKYAAQGGRIFITAKDSAELPNSPAIVRSGKSPGSEYLSRLEEDFVKASQALAMGDLAGLT